MKESTEELRGRLVETIRKRFEPASAEEKKAVQDRLWNMIQYAISRHDYWEGYRTRYLTIASALVTVAAAGMAILVNAGIIGQSSIPLYLSFIVLGGTGVYLIWRFREETSPEYPYRKEAKVKSWIYFYTLTRDEKLLRDSLRVPSAQEQAAHEYVAALEKFTTEWSALDEWGRIQEDLEQVLILFTLQAYKRMFVRRMARILQVGVILFVLLLAVAGFLYLTHFGGGVSPPPVDPI